MSDTNKNPELKVVEPKETEGKKKKTDLTEDIKPAPPSSIYQVLMAKDAYNVYKRVYDNSSPAKVHNRKR